ncbi:MAG: hypothetical protein ACC660_06945, partial [Acidimicrobiales bacterium]
VALATATLPSLSLLAIVAMSVGEIIMVSLARVIGAGVRALHGVPASVRVQLALLVGRLVVLVGMFLVTELTVERLAVGWLFSNIVIVAWLFLIVMPRDDIHVRLTQVRVRDFQVAGAL